MRRPNSSAESSASGTSWRSASLEDIMIRDYLLGPLRTVVPAGRRQEGKISAFEKTAEPWNPKETRGFCQPKPRGHPGAVRAACAPECEGEPRPSADTPASAARDATLPRTRGRKPPGPPWDTCGLPLPALLEGAGERLQAQIDLLGRSDRDAQALGEAETGHGSHDHAAGQQGLVESQGPAGPRARGGDRHQHEVRDRGVRGQTEP